MPEPLRVPLSALKVNPGGYLESARQRRVLLTRRGRVVGELVPLDHPGAAPLRPLLGIATDLIRLDPDLDLTEPAEADWDAPWDTDGGAPSCSTPAPSSGWPRASRHAPASRR